jgi:autotransporter-associated beta strand protein
MGAGTFGVAMNLTGTAGESLTLPSITLQNTSGSPTSIHNSANLIVDGPITMAAGATDGDILKDQAGTLTFEGNTANTYTGITTVSGGTLVLDKSAGVDAVPHDLDVFGGGTVQLLTNGQIDPGSHILLDAVPSAAVLDLHGFNNTFGTGSGVFLSFVAGGTLMTGAGTATLGGDVQFTGTSGTATISGNLNLGGAGRTFTIARGSSITDMQISAGISGGPGSGTAFTKTGPGILDLTGANTYAGDTIVNQGTLTVDYSGSLASVNLTVGGGIANINGSIPANTNLTVNSSGVAKFGVSQGSGILFRNLAAINLSSNGQVVVADPGAGASNHANRSLLVTGALIITNGSNTWQGLVNLNGNDAIVHNASVPNIYSQLKSGFNSAGGYWNGTAGIISTTAAADTTHLTTLGYRTGGSAFDGQGTSSSDVLIKYTYYGDANLDGTVNGADYQQIDSGFGLHLTGWANGDFNYDGVVDGSDFSLIDNAYNKLGASGASPLAVVANTSTFLAAVPEPGTLSIVAFGAAALLARRRNRHR